MSKTRRKRHRPTDPAEAARLAMLRRNDPARWNANREALALPQNADVAITEPQRGKVENIKRWDCFETLAIEAGALAAVRRYQDELAIRYGVEGSTRMAEHVDGAGATELLSQRAVDAGKRLDDLARLVAEPWMLTLIRHLCEPMVLKAERINWHAIVKRDLGLIDRGMQARAVKVAAEGVRRAWEAYDAKRMRRAA